MKRKIVWLILSCLMVVALVLVSCGPAAEEEEEMSPRKSPYEHPVSSHIRAGKRVQNYRRGKGDAPLRSPRRSRVVGNPSMSSALVLIVVLILIVAVWERFERIQKSKGN